MASSKKKPTNWDLNAKRAILQKIRYWKISLIFFIFLFALMSCNSYISTTIIATSTFTPSLTATATHTPTPTQTPTKTLTPTQTSTPIGGGENIIFSYVSFVSDGERYQMVLNVALPDKTLSIPMESKNYTTPHIAISPIGDVVVIEVKTETATDITAVYIQESPITPIILTSLPEQASNFEIRFSPDGKWLSIKYISNRRDYQRFIEMETGRFLISYDCREITTFASDDTAYCRDGVYFDDFGKLNLTQNSMNKSFLTLPRNKLFSKTKLNWHAKTMIPALDSFIIERSDGSFVLADQLETLGKRTFWDADQIDDLIDSPIIAKLPTSASVFQFLLSPDKKQIAVTGINSHSFGMGPGIDQRTFTFVAPIDQTYYPQDINKPGSLFYVLSWSPDSKALIGLSKDGTTLSIWDAATMSELKVLYKSKYIGFLNTTINGIAVSWQP